MTPLKFIDWANVWLVDPTTGLYARLRKPGTYGNLASGGSDTAGSRLRAQAAAADRKALAANPDEAAKLEAAGEPDARLRARRRRRTTTRRSPPRRCPT